MGTILGVGDYQDAETKPCRLTSFCRCSSKLMSTPTMDNNHFALVSMTSPNTSLLLLDVCTYLQLRRNMSTVGCAIGSLCIAGSKCLRNLSPTRTDHANSCSHLWIPLHMVRYSEPWLRIFAANGWGEVSKFVSVAEREVSESRFGRKHGARSGSVVSRILMMSRPLMVFPLRRLVGSSWILQSMPGWPWLSVGFAAAWDS